MKVGRAIRLTAVCLVASACYHQVVNTGLAPGATVIEKPWTATWVFGLVPAQPLDVTQQCPAGIATVSTQMSVPNWLASVITAGIYDPRTVTVTCAQGRADASTREIHVARTAPLAEREAAFTQAVALSQLTNAPVVIRF